MGLKGNASITNCRLYMKDGNKLECLVKISCKLGQLFVERFNNGYLGTSHVTGCG